MSYQFASNVSISGISGDSSFIIHLVKSAHNDLIIACHVVRIHERSYLFACLQLRFLSLILRSEINNLIFIVLYDSSKISIWLKCKIFILSWRNMINLVSFLRIRHLPLNAAAITNMLSANRYTIPRRVDGIPRLLTNMVYMKLVPGKVIILGMLLFIHDLISMAVKHPLKLENTNE